MEQHLGYYHQSVPELSRDELFDVMFQTVWKDFCADHSEYKFHSHFSFTLIYSISFFFLNLSLSFFFDRTIACLCFLSPYNFREWIALHCHWALTKNSFLVGQMFQNVIFDRNQPAQWIQGKTRPADFFFFVRSEHTLTHGNHAVHNKAQAQSVYVKSILN